MEGGRGRDGGGADLAEGEEGPRAGAQPAPSEAEGGSAEAKAP